MDERKEKEVEVEHREKKSVGVAVIKYATYLIIFFGILWLLISYSLPMF